MTQPNKRKYRKLSEAEWISAVELHKIGYSYKEIAERLSVSERAVCMHLPEAIAKVDAADAAVTERKENCISVRSPLPTMENPEECVRYIRQEMWSDVNLVRHALQREINAPVPNGRTIRALATAAEALSNAWKMSKEITRMDELTPQDELPVLVVREITPEEIAELRKKQKTENQDLTSEELALLETEENSLIDDTTEVIEEKE
ncbi:helix-turn-helix domain-containing protein [Acetobacter orleanensis]|uniref:Uncharacterized protein n=1 Tax=Acetobacter orleanensis TaxID=104099 RepID=A0A4Y3TI06_9PROT|nr:hypothetical protein [Acetobacter orleanensis]KXV62308.1 hypothetical protein AD949_11100 [Acetobacter orleanensis]PCD79475.1 hypothetical protein CO710_07510 [Acetobacter orleanensis]GAN69124.1 hypothetical protein Abol_026_026 [Acetobacter orleanensis JCM 7639]GBR25792.1 hypothetical protein AA0473_0981 [Acetobacter orleanensis NRIC 0473]GEB82611.1 hypothetical protein AOR01nite_10880 [Acetobacter orleanensis]